MVKAELFERIRHDSWREGLSVRALSRKYGVRRRLVREALTWAEPGSRAAGLAMAFKLIEAAQDRWRAVNAPHLVALARAGPSSATVSWLSARNRPRRDRRRAAVGHPGRQRVLLRAGLQGWQAGRTARADPRTG